MEKFQYKPPTIPETHAKQVDRLGDLVDHTIAVEKGQIERNERKPDDPPRDVVALRHDVRHILDALESPMAHPKEVKRELERFKQQNPTAWKRLLLSERFFRLAKQHDLVSGPATGLGRAAFDFVRWSREYAKSTTEHECKVDRDPNKDPRAQRIENAKLSMWCSIGVKLWGAEIGSAPKIEGYGVPGVPVKVDKDGKPVAITTPVATIGDNGTGELKVGPAKFRVNPGMGAVGVGSVPVGTLEHAREAAKGSLDKKISDAGG